MRIDAYTQVQQLYSTQNTHKTARGKQADFHDKLQISSKGKDIQTARAAVAEAPDVREEVVTPLKEQVDAGTYAVAPESFAEKLFEKYNTALLGSF